MKCMAPRFSIALRWHTVKIRCFNVRIATPTNAYVRNWADAVHERSFREAIGFPLNASLVSAHANAWRVSTRITSGRSRGGVLPAVEQVYTRCRLFSNSAFRGVSRMLRRIAAFAVAFSALAVSAIAQEFRGTITGRVTDAQAAAIPNAKI